MAIAITGNLVKETTETTGTGPYQLDGPPSALFRAIGEVAASGTAVWYHAVLGDPADPTGRELGRGTFTAGTPDQLARDAILFAVDPLSGPTANPVAWDAGTKTVFLVTPAEMVNLLQQGLGRQMVALETGDRALVSTDHGKLLLFTGDEPATLTLPAASGLDAWWSVRVHNAGTAALTLAAAGSDTVDGEESIVLSPGVGCRAARTASSAWRTDRGPNLGTGAGEIPLTDHVLLRGSFAGFVPAAAFAPHPNSPAGALEVAESATSVSYAFVPFPDAVLTIAVAHAVLPKAWDGGDLRFRVSWTRADAGSGDVVWEVGAQIRTPDDDLLADDRVNTAFAAMPVPDAHALARTGQSGAVALGSAEAPVLQLTVARLGQAAGDTYDGAARLLGVEVWLDLDKGNDA